jgi:hypothetical protein
MLCAHAPAVVQLQHARTTALQLMSRVKKYTYVNEGSLQLLA